MWPPTAAQAGVQRVAQRDAAHELVVFDPPQVRLRHAAGVVAGVKVLLGAQGGDEAIEGGVVAQRVEAQLEVAALVVELDERPQVRLLIVAWTVSRGEP